MSTLARTNDAQSFHQRVKCCSRVERRNLWAADDPVRILGKGERQDPEFRKKYLELVDAEPTPVMPNEMEKLVRELPRDPEIVALFQNINEAGPLPSR
jgi:hypothetical protein